MYDVNMCGSGGAGLLLIVLLMDVENGSVCGYCDAENGLVRGYCELR